MGILLPNQKPPEKEESDFDKLLKGLQVAGQLTGVYGDFKKIDQMKVDTELKTQEATRQRELFQLQKNKDGREQEEHAAKAARGFVTPKEHNPLAQELANLRITEARRKQDEEAYKKTPKGKLENTGADAKTRLGSVATALQSVTSLESAIADRGLKPEVDPSETPLVGRFLFTEKEVTSLRNKLADDIGRMRSGGAIQADEEKRFLGMLPTVGDAKDPDAMFRKIQNLRQEFETRMGGFGFDSKTYAEGAGLDPGTLGVGQFNPRERYRAKYEKPGGPPKEQVAGFTPPPLPSLNEKMINGVPYIRVDGGWKKK